MAETSCKNWSLDDRIYNGIKSNFVEMVDPRLLMFYLTMRLADEERVRNAFEKDGRAEAAGELLRLLKQRPNWCDQLVAALRNPMIDMDFLAKQIEDLQSEVLMVVDVEMRDNEGDEPMEVDTTDTEPSSSISQQDRLKIFKEIIDKTFKNLVMDPRQLKETLKCLSQISDILFCGATCGCLELRFRVKSIKSLYVLRALYQGGALCNALSRDILSSDVRERIRKEAASQGLHFKSIHFTLQISDEDFMECERFLSSADLLPPPRGFLAAKTSPVQPFSEPRDANMQDLMNKLPITYQQFIERVADLTFDPSGDQEATLTLAGKPLCVMVKECMDRIHEKFKTDDIVQKDLVKIALNLLAKSFVHKKKNVNTICIQKGENVELMWEKKEKEFLAEQKTITDEYRDLTLSSSVERLVSEGWLVEVVDRVACVGKTRYRVPLSLRRDYIVCYLLPTRLQNLNINLFLNSDSSLESSTDLTLFQFASIILPYVACYSGIEIALPDKVLYFPGVALFLSSVHAHEQSKEVKDRLQNIWKHDEFPSFLNIQTSADVDNHWKTWKAVAANLGCDHIEMVDRTKLDEMAFENRIAVIESALRIECGNVISLTSLSDFQLALRSVALLDLLPSVVERQVFVMKGEQRPDAAKSPVSKPDGVESPAPTIFHPPLESDDRKGDSVKMRPKTSRSISHETTSQRFSGFSEKERHMLQKEGCLSLDSKKVSGDYILRRSSDWSFNLDMSNHIIDKKKVSLLCRFLPQLDHVTRLSFKSSGLDTSLIKEIVQALNPHTVRGLSLVGCTVELGEVSIGLSRMTKLDFLDLEDTGISDNSCSYLVKEIENLKHLKEINVGCNDISHCGFSVLSSALVSKINLRALRVHANKLGEAGAAILAQLVFSLRHLEILSIWGCALGDEGVNLLSEQFPVHKKLKRLSMRDNNTSYLGSSGLYKNLSSCKYMEFLDCNENTNIGKEQSDFVSKNLIDMLIASSSWDHLSLWNCNIGQLSIFNKLPDFKGLSGITYLCLQKNGMSDDSVKDLSMCLIYFQYLQHLNLRENQVGDEGATWLANALADKVHLEDLWLDWNIFGHVGAEALIQCVLELPKVMNVDLFSSPQLSPPEQDYLAHLVSEQVRTDGDLYTAEKGQLTLRI